MATVKFRKKLGRILLSVQGEGGQLQTSNPPLRALHQGPHIISRQREMLGLHKKELGLSRRKREISEMEFNKLVPGAQLGHGERRLVARGKHQVNMCWQVSKEVDQRLMNGLHFNQMIIIQDNHHLTL